MGVPPGVGVLPDRLTGKHPIAFSYAAFLGVVFIVAGLLGALTDLPPWAVGAISTTVAVTVERTGQWWYGRTGSWRCSRPAEIGLAVGIIAATLGLVGLLARARD